MIFLFFGFKVLFIFLKKNSSKFPFALSGDNDFANPINQLLRDDKKIALFAAARQIASKLNELQKRIVYSWYSKNQEFYLLEKRNFTRIKAKETPCGASKL